MRFYDVFCFILLKESGMLILYIDPGTGSMLFAILIGVLGAAGFVFRNVRR